MFGFAVLSFIGCSLLFWQLKHEPTPQYEYFLEIGDVPSDIQPGAVQGMIKVDTTHLQDEAKNYRLIGVEMHTNELQDPLDTDDLQKSAVYDITPDPVNIRINLEPSFSTGLGDNMVLLLAPKSLTPDMFTTLREAEQQGAQVLQHRFFKSGRNNVP